ncbi:uncharacterized protein LOC143236122 [Tachypleus tridentatus]|uniref:uncharacterized protein LOC143236122 n=1 Tax=Tachypleus tridentatus TaxID=6853 RepID=UPI003FD29CB1
MSGEKVRPLVIGHSAKPRCFRNSGMNSLGVDYCHNRKAWMTIPIFTEWAKKFNNNMKLQKRNVLLFIDNCTAHVAIPLSNVKIVLLPPNATSKLQPCDAGVIQTVKLLYRKTFLRQLLFHMDNDQTATGEVSNESEDNVSENQSDPDFRPVLNGVTLGEYVNFDNETPVCDDSVSDNIIACPEEIESDDGEECDDTTVESFEPIDCATAMSYAEKLLHFSLKHGKMDIVDCMVAVSKDIETVVMFKYKGTKYIQVVMFKFKDTQLHSSCFKFKGTSYIQFVIFKFEDVQLHSDCDALV